MLTRLRKWLSGRVEATRFEAAVVLADREGTLTATYPDGSVQAISWDDLERVEILTNDSGPWGADVWWVLTGGIARCRYPQGATGETELIPKLQSLPGFDNKALIEAMGCTSNRVFVCWDRRAATTR